MADVPLAERREATQGFDPLDASDATQKIYKTIKARRGQRKFRDELIDAYKIKCAVTGGELLFILEAAHIFPYLDDSINHVTNGLLLRADIHTLFDLGYINAHPETYKISIAACLCGSEYRGLNGKTLALPNRRRHYPNSKALARRAHEATTLQIKG